MTLTPDAIALRNAFGTFLTGVTVVTTLDAKGEPIGFTANSFTSVSLDPPLLLICLAKTSSNFDPLTQGAGFAVNILAEHQIEISNTFARPSDDRFANVDWKTGPYGSPILAGVSAWFDCSRHNVVDAGDHVILIGKVEAFEATPTAGLGYARGAYVTPSTAADALDVRTDLIVSALIEQDGKVLLVEDGAGGLGLPERPAGRAGVSATLEDLLDETGLAAESGFVYSVYEDSARHRQHIVFLCQSKNVPPSLGTFIPLTSGQFDRVQDPVLLTMLERFSEEHSLGRYGVYVGTERQGQIRPIKRER